MAKPTVPPKPRKASPRVEGLPKRLRKLEPLLAAYENLWRAAALKGLPQFRGIACGGAGESGNGHCAWTIGDDVIGTLGVRVDWRCPECGWRALLLPQVMIHLNNAHHFDWLDLANKFRPTLEADLIPSTRRRRVVA